MEAVRICFLSRSVCFGDLDVSRKTESGESDRWLVDGDHVQQSKTTVSSGVFREPWWTSRECVLPRVVWTQEMLRIAIVPSYVDTQVTQVACKQECVILGPFPCDGPTHLTDDRRRFCTQR